MPALETIASPLLSALPGVRHAFFTRSGGVSKGVHRGLNVGIGSKDNPEAVQENRARAAAALGIELSHLLTAFQVHSSIPAVANAPWNARPEADAVVTRTPRLACGAMAADCAPILLADSQGGVVAAAHAGWKGALGGIIEATLEAMEGQGAKRGRIVAAVGPCIGPASYEVGADFLDRFMSEAPGSDRFFTPGATAGKHQFDLPAFVLRRLQAAGVDQAEWVGRDTCAEEGLFFSNRRGFLKGEADYGRLLSAILLTG